MITRREGSESSDARLLFRRTNASSQARRMVTVGYRHLASPRFWKLYQSLPAQVRALADKNYVLLKSDPRHPSLHFNKLNKLWSVRVGEHYRTLGIDVKEGIYWFWIGPHAEYDRIAG